MYNRTFYKRQNENPKRPVAELEFLEICKLKKVGV